MMMIDQNKVWQSSKHHTSYSDLIPSVWFTEGLAYMGQQILSEYVTHVMQEHRALSTHVGKV